MDGAKTQGILQPTEDIGLDIRQLPGHDFVDSWLFVKPSAFRFHFSSLTYYLCNSKPPQMEVTGTEQPRPDKDQT